MAILFFFLSAELASADNPAKTATLYLPSGETITAEVADTASKRTLGLMFRDSLPPALGMLFIFETEDYHGIWMKNCRFPLDILWLDKERRVIHAEENVLPCDGQFCRTYYPVLKALYVVELNAGLIAREKIRVGAKLQF
jgi:uncharacterized protein